MYGDIINLQDRIQEAGYTGPYMVTEWGATGHWEVPTTDWGAPIEESSTQKAVSIRERYINAIQIDDKNCLGSYVFLWGQKQERTPTWYGLFTEDHEETAAIEEIHYFWNGLTYPENRVPKITEPKLLGKTAVESIKVDVNSELVLTYSAIDSDNDVMTSRIEILPEATDLGDGGDHESRPQSIDGLLIDKSEGKITFSAPDSPGAYRVFLYVADGQGHAATINIPFYVND